MKRKDTVEVHNPFSSEGFRISSKSNHWPNMPNCVAVKIDGDGVKVRDTKLKDSPTLSFTTAEWDAFIKGVKQGEFEV